MAYSDKRLSKAYGSAFEIPFDDRSKFILFSDSHRGTNDWADDFSHNQHLFFFAMRHYFDEGFTYIENGDGDELWENDDFPEIREAHSHVFWLLRRFHQENRFYMLYGNHDMVRKSDKVVRETLYQYFDLRTAAPKPLFEDIRVYESLLLRHAKTGKQVLILHGHQADGINDRLWWLSRFFVRIFWRYLQLLGYNDPTSPAKNYRKRIQIESNLIRWADEHNHILIAGHTHRPRFPGAGAPPYFNSGSCIHPRCITGIEIQNGEIALIKWSLVADAQGVLRVAREVLEGPRPLGAYAA